MTTRYRYVRCMDYLFRMSQRNFERMLVHIANDDGDFNLEDFGAKRLAICTTNITDMEAEDAINELNNLSTGHLVVECYDCGELELKKLAKGTRAKGWLCRECQKESDEP